MKPRTNYNYTINNSFLKSICLAFLMAFFLPVYMFSQQSTCTDCAHQCLCLKNFAGNYTAAQKQVLRDNWSDYVGNDLEAYFPLRAADQSIVNNVFSIKMDALGCVYPDFELEPDLQYQFLNDGQDIRRIAKLCFYMLVFQKRDTLIARHPEHKALFTDLYNITTRNLGPRDEFQKLFDFVEKWNAHFLPKMMARLQNRISAGSIRKIVYFVQGFNVPYALAQVQGNAVFSDVINAFAVNAKPYNDVLFIRLFWPSHTSKYSHFDSTNCNVDNIKNLPTGKLYSYVSNRVYMGSLTIREVLSKLDPSITHHFISHSFGASLTTGTVLNPKAKISDTTTHFNSMLVERYNTKPFPTTQRMSFYLSAPGIPGETTFAHLNAAEHSNHKFYISYNENDRILRKHAFRFLGINAARKNATTLGCNWRDEIVRVGKLAEQMNLRTNFHFRQTSTRTNHDYFCYREQADFQQFFRQFVVENIVSGTQN